MSYSSLYGITGRYHGKRIKEYKNSWLFSPVIYRVLPDKYIPEEIKTPYGYKKGIIGPNGSDVWVKTNEKINHCQNTQDRICWEMANQQIFFTKDRKCIADSIRKFAGQNKEYDRTNDGTCPLGQEHIIERFHEIAADIENLDETEYPYFVFKNTSCDDSVENWFCGDYDEEADECEEKSLKDHDEFLAEFVVIRDGEIAEFISNEDYSY